jgi:hypothetical protein
LCHTVEGEAIKRLMWRLTNCPATGFAAVRKFEKGCFWAPIRTRLLTKSGPAGRESESFGQRRGQRRGSRRSHAIRRELSARATWRKSLPIGRENDERRELSALGVVR